MSSIFAAHAPLFDPPTRLPAPILAKYDQAQWPIRVLLWLGCHWSYKGIGERLLQREWDITRLLGRLEKRGFISPKQDEKDRRSVVRESRNVG